MNGRTSTFSNVRSILPPAKPVTAQTMDFHLDMGQPIVPDFTSVAEREYREGLFAGRVQKFQMVVITVVSQVPDAEERLIITEGKVDLGKAKSSMDTMDEYGVEEALRLREAGHDIQIVAIAVGPSRVEEVLRGALALGADRAVMVQSEAAMDVIALSKVIATVAKTEGASLVFCGGQQADSDSQALGPAIAERLGWPQVTWTTALKLEANALTGKHDVDQGVEMFSLPLPACVTTQQGLNEPRYPTLPNIMKARKKEIRRESLDAFGAVPKLKISGAEIQSRKRMQIMVDGKAPDAATKLADFLRNEAKVIQ